MTASAAMASVMAMNQRNRKPRPQLPEGQKAYVFNVSDQTWKIGMGGLGEYTVPACKDGEQYSEPLVIADYTFEEYATKAGDGTMDWNVWTAKQISDQIVNENASSIHTGNLKKYGVFISGTPVPKDEEVKAAREQLFQTYMSLVEEGNRFSQDPNGYKEITANHLRAAKYTKQETAWSKAVHDMVDCPVCQSPMRINTVKHSCGAIIDKQKAFDAGLLSREQAMMFGFVKEERGKDIGESKSPQHTR